MISLRIKGEETLDGELIKTPEQFIGDLCDRINVLHNTVMDEENKELQLVYLIGFLKAFAGRLNRVCERK